MSNTDLNITTKEYLDVFYKNYRGIILRDYSVGINLIGKTLVKAIKDIADKLEVSFHIQKHNEGTLVYQALVDSPELIEIILDRYIKPESRDRNTFFRKYYLRINSKLFNTPKFPVGVYLEVRATGPSKFILFPCMPNNGKPFSLSLPLLDIAKLIVRDLGISVSHYPKAIMNKRLTLIDFEIWTHKLHFLINFYTPDLIYKDRHDSLKDAAVSIVEIPGIPSKIIDEIEYRSNLSYLLDCSEGLIADILKIFNNTIARYSVII